MLKLIRVLKTFCDWESIARMVIYYCGKVIMVLTHEWSRLSKKDFTSFDIAAVVHELKHTIPNSRVNNIYQLNDKTLLLKLHKTNTGTLRLMMEAGRRIHLTAYELEKPLAPPSFCMALRKHLRNAWLLDVDQHEFERIVIFINTKSAKDSGMATRIKKLKLAPVLK